MDCIPVLVRTELRGLLLMLESERRDKNTRFQDSLKNIQNMKTSNEVNFI